MKMTKIMPLAITALLVGSMTSVPLASAKEGATVVTNAMQQDEQSTQVQPAFIKVVGTVEKVEERNKAIYYTTKDGENTNVLVVNKDTVLFDNTAKEVKQLQKGDKVIAYTFANKPMLMIYPPQYNPDVVIVETKEIGNVTVDFFDKDLVNLANTLTLNVDKDTTFQSLSGKKVSVVDLAEQHLLVFYTMTTRSIPAQTVPSKVVVLDTIVKEQDEEVSIDAVIQDIIKNDFYEVDGTTMVPLRLIAEQLGYNVKSTGTGAIISKGALSYTITRGEKAFGYNKALRYFDVAPALLEPSKTYVPIPFIKELMQ